MAGTQKLSKKESRLIKALVKHYVDSQHTIKAFAESVMAYITNNKDLRPHVHSTKWRLKDTSHFREKLRRKALEAKAAGKAFDVTTENLFTKITDLAGIRIIHLHSDEFPSIHKALTGIITDQKLNLVEAPVANCWDLEFKQFYTKLGVEVTERASLYTTVHYIIQANATSPTLEIQVRTLVDELWGEVSHRVNYPTPTRSTTCAQQLRVLARFTTGCSRLVDSIFHSFKEQNNKARRKRAKSAR